MTECVINLEKYRAKEGNRISKVFTGRDKGKYVREDSKIDELEKNDSNSNFARNPSFPSFLTTLIIIPNDIYSINPSFLEEFLVNVVKKLGKDGFLAKFEFESLGDYEYQEPLYQAIDRILKEQTALDK